MAQKNPINAEELLEIAEKSTDKESYRVIHKTQQYRIGTGARLTSPDPSFFIEVIINLSDETKKVDLNELEKITRILRTLQTNKYTLNYEDDNCIQCETTKSSQELNQEYLSIKKLLETQMS
jgi:predicted Zn-ribbon and HTH transcriptional regulator